MSGAIASWKGIGRSLGQQKSGTKAKPELEEEAAETGGWVDERWRRNSMIRAIVMEKRRRGSIRYVDKKAKR